jgi:excisionase family DNA binding protein
MTEMQTSNPFELILSRLDQLQLTVNTLADTSQKPATKEHFNPERLLDLTEAAQTLRKPVGTVRYYIHNRNLPAMKVGKSYLIKLHALLEWVNEFNKKESPKDAANPMMMIRNRYRKS